MNTLILMVLGALALSVSVGAGRASAETTELYSGNTTLPSGTAIEVDLQSGTTGLMTDTEGGAINTCVSGSATGKTSNTTATSVSGTGNIIALGECTWVLQTVENGGFAAERIAGTDDGTLVGIGQLATVKVFSLVTCLYGTGEGTHLGTVNGVMSGHATVAIKATILERGEKKALCPDTTILNMVVVVTSPTGLNFAS